MPSILFQKAVLKQFYLIIIPTAAGYTEHLECNKLYSLISSSQQPNDVSTVTLLYMKKLRLREK